MDLFEYQGKQYFSRFGIPVPSGEAVTTVDDAVAAADRIGYPVVVKAQVQVGGRGKAGGIKLAANANEARNHAGNILGMDIKGHTVGVLWVEAASDIAEEYYASFTLDRSAKLHYGMLSTQGGMDIEGVAEENPEAIARLHINPVDGLTEDVCRDWIARAGIPEAAVEGTFEILTKLYTCYVEGDASLVEINPLILGKDGKVSALDSKVSLDESAAPRHPEWEAFEQSQPMNPREQAAKEKGLQYIALEGEIGIMANGAGLAMSTLDVVSEVGGSAANFLDVGGGASAEVVANAMEIITSDPSVKVIFINIFGGITHGDKVAGGIVEALQRVNLQVPLVIRIDGTRADLGREILAKHVSEKLVMADSMLDGAKKAVAFAKGDN